LQHAFTHSEKTPLIPLDAWVTGSKGKYRFPWNGWNCRWIFRFPEYKFYQPASYGNLRATILSRRRSGYPHLKEQKSPGKVFSDQQPLSPMYNLVPIKMKKSQCQRHFWGMNMGLKAGYQDQLQDLEIRKVAGDRYVGTLFEGMVV
jgi:hypothetical protein